mgnify:FL=1
MRVEEKESLLIDINIAPCWTVISENRTVNSLSVHPGV